MKIDLQYYRDSKRQYRWRLKRGNTKILAASSEGFTRKAGARKNFYRTRAAMALVPCIALLLMLSGCGGLKGKVVYHKSTFFGFRVVTANPTSSSPMPAIEFGLARDEWVSLPTSTNAVYVAPFSEHATASLTVAHQNAQEGISTLPTNPPNFYQVFTNTP